MSYPRVIPRDLFNEASLLKCLGRLWVETERFSPAVLLEHDGEPFDVRQSQGDGSLTVENIQFSIRLKPYELYRPLNSRESGPLFMMVGDDAIRVFTEDGKLSGGMLSVIGGQ